MSKINKALRKLVNHKNKKKLKNKDFTLIASNCNGTFMLHDLGLRFNSPFINLWIRPAEYVKMLQNLDEYINSEMTFIKEDGIKYPIGKLKDVRIYFQHYKTEEEAKRKWYERLKRMNKDNMFILFTDRDGCTKADLCAFDKLPYKNKVVFTNRPYKDIKSAVYIKGFEKEQSVGMCFEFKNKITPTRHFDSFDYIGWFNGKENR